MSGQRVRSDQWVRELSDHLCECGCGQRTYVSPRTYSERGIFKGRPRRFVHGHGARVWMAQWSHAKSLVRPVSWRPCACGCGVWTSRLLVLGHRRPDVRRMFADPIGPVRACACGCGRPVATLAARWMPGHDKRRTVGPEYVVDPVTGCWLWQRRLNSSGYAHARREGRDRPMHRVFYEAHYGSGSADGLDIHHECGVKRCVNPEHLTALTQQEHARIHGEMARELWRLRKAAA